jgi:malonate-semialdehyde dehydrogenase (acetylating)/methylmalonate-semialdehyde dehydrogenase
MKTENMEYEVYNYINGKREKNTGDSEFTVYNPAFGKRIATVYDTGNDEVDNTVDFAYSAFLKWSKIPITDRIKFLFRLENLMRENADELAKMVTIEHGKTFKESQGEVMRAIENVEAACSSTYNIMGRNSKNIAGGIDEELFRVPMGVFAAIAPFNFPIMVAFWFIPYAVGLGNTIIVKPSEKTPLTLQKTVDLFEQAGFPPGVISIVNGSVNTVNAILNNKKISGVSFVGSTGAARYIVSTAAANHKRAQAGASAKNYELVMPDADLDKVVPHLISSFYGNAGERCLAGSALVTLPENHKKLVEKFKMEAEKLKLGYGLDDKVSLGPLIRSEHKQRVLGYIDSGVSEGANLTLDGRKFSAGKYSAGYFLGPSIFDNADPDMKIVREEIFGPVASVVEAKNIDDAIEIINKSQYGNASTIFTKSGEYAEKYIEGVQAGNIGVNIGVAAPIAFYPFAGYKDSFFGDLHAQGGPDHVMFYTDSKVVIKRW